MLPRERILESLLELTDRSSGRSQEALVEKALRAALSLIDCDAVVAVTARGKRLDRVALHRSQLETRTLEAGTGSGEGLRALLRSGVPVMSPDLADDGRFTAADACPDLDAGPAVFASLRQREQAPGYLAIYRRRGAARFDADDTTALLLIAAWASAMLENRRLAESIEKLAVTDDLTQVYNYRFLKSALRREIKRAGRFGQELALVMIDVDSLKAYNDRNGHLRGSYLLKEIARLLAEQVRSFDLVAKYGGDEFTLILPQTDREGAMVVAERIRAVVAAHAFPLVSAGSITISSGVAMFPEDAGDGTGLIQQADRALYLAKQRGRNRVETFWTHAA